MYPLLRKLFQGPVWERIFRERLSEPIHLNLISAAVAVAGSFRQKVYFDLVLRPNNAFCLLKAATLAKENGHRSITAIEFGVANGAGLLNMAEIARRVTRSTGVKIELVGFDTGTGMPPAKDYRDHPELYGPGDFPMQDFNGLRSKLPPGSRLIIGDIADTVPGFLDTLDSPIGYVVVDVDYYSSAVECLKVFTGRPEKYLPLTLVYLDDIHYPQHNPWQGEYLAVREFNEDNEFRKLNPYNLLRNSRVLKRAAWIDHIYLLHVLDARRAALEPATRRIQVLPNPYLALHG